MTSFQKSVDCVKYLKNNFTSRTSGNKEIDNFIQEIQLKTGYYDDYIIFEWIPYDQFYDIKEIDKNGFITVYSVTWRDGPLYWNKQNNKYVRVPNKKVALKRLHNSQYLVNFFIDEAKKYSTEKFCHDITEIYGISQNPTTNDYILVLNNSINLVKWTSGIKKIDDFIQEMQLRVNKNDDIIFEWIPYSQFNEFKEIGKNGFMAIYSAIWKNGPLHYIDRYNAYGRNSNKKITLKCLHKSQKTIDKVLNKARIYSKILEIYGISQNPNTKDFILVLNNINWPSGNKKVDSFIQEMQLNNKYDGIVFEWIPYDQFDKIKETSKYGSITEYSAIWKDGPLYYKRDSNKEIVLKYLHNSQNSIDFLINKVKKYIKNYRYDNFLKLYGISQNPDTKNYILVQSNSINWMSKNEQIDDFILEMQFKSNDFATLVFEWIPYDQFDKIKETSKNKSVTVYSAMWKDGPLYNKLHERNSNKEVALKCLHNLQNPVESLINKAKIYSKILDIYGISQNPDTNDYILVLNNVTWESGNKKIDDFIQEMQLKFNDLLFEWIPHNQFNEINKIGKSGFATIYSAIWKDGPIFKKNQQNGNYTRDSNKEVTLKCLNKSQDPIESVINEAKKYLTKEIDRKIFKPYGISQNPDTAELILVLNNITWKNGNKKIDDFILEMQLKSNDLLFEWIPYSQFNEIKTSGESSFATIYSAIWKNGPICKNNQQNGNYARDSNKEVTLKCLNKSPIETVIDEAKKYLTKEINRKIFKPYGISLNPNTNDFIVVLNNITWMSENKEINDFIQETQSRINDSLFEWIPYNQFNEIKEIDKNEFMTICSAIWIDGPLCKNWLSEYTRDSNKEVTLKCLNNSQDLIEFVINEAKRYSTKEFNRKIFKPYGITQNPDSNNFILVLNNITWISGNEKVDVFVQEAQSRVSDLLFEWIPYNQFNEIKEISKDNHTSVYSAIWKDGPIYRKNQWNENYMRDPNKEVTLKCLNNSKELIDSVIKEAKSYLTKEFNKKIFKPYGISQNPDTNDFILISDNITWTSGNKKIDDFIQDVQLKINDSLFEWIPYNQFNEIKKIRKGDFATVYSAIWKNGPLYNNNQLNENYARDSNKKVALKILDNSQNLSSEFLNKVKVYLTKMVNKNNILKIYGMSQDPITKEYIIVLYYAEGGNFNNWISVNENFKCFSWKKKLRTLFDIACGLKDIHEKQMVHHGFHTGNILFSNISMENINKIFISDMGLCGKVNDVNKSNVYGVIPYVAPEVLKGRPYTQVADIYSFGMIMYFVATGRQPFDNCAHNFNLALDICKGIRPKLNEPEAPKSYINLMEKCWNLIPNDRPSIIELCQSLWSISINNSEIEKAENYRNLHLSSLMKNRQITIHYQAIYTSRFLNSFIKDLQ
ncbi:unnamed protein product [Rhizophagus irregularis]|nr:unnamed protein product [Rhizophagus irregularis]